MGDYAEITTAIILGPARMILPNKERSRDFPAAPFLDLHALGMARRYCVELLRDYWLPLPVRADAVRLDYGRQGKAHPMTQPVSPEEELKALILDLDVAARDLARKDIHHPAIRVMHRAAHRLERTDHTTEDNLTEQGEK